MLSVGFIGLGVMGASMARRLVQAGHPVTVYNRTAARCAPLVAAGARQAASPREAARGSDVVISVVTDSPDVEAVLQALAARSLRFLDAPVTGGDVGAREGTLSILVGGDAATLEAVRPVLAVMGKRITHCGGSGAGQTVKACNQILCAMNMIGVVEALHLARLGGLDQAVVLEALAPGAGGSWAFEKLGPRIASGDFAPGFMVKLIQKDLRIVQELAGAVQLPLEGTALAQRLFADNEAHGEGELGTQAMYKVLERLMARRTPA
jgi:3-hydroxyisobutyrate dehydrogenase